MARLYVCDKCQTTSKTWSTRSVELPSPSFIGNAICVELCESCLKEVRKILKAYMEGAITPVEQAYDYAHRGHS
jgi:hypothetical protein